MFRFFTGPYVGAPVDVRLPKSFARVFQNIELHAMDQKKISVVAHGVNRFIQFCFFFFSARYLFLSVEAPSSFLDFFSVFWAISAFL